MIYKILLLAVFSPSLILGCQAEGNYAIPGAAGQHIPAQDLEILHDISSYVCSRGKKDNETIDRCKQNAYWKGFGGAASVAAVGCAVASFSPEMSDLCSNCFVAGLGLLTVLTGRALFCRTLSTNRLYWNCLAAQNRVIAAAREKMKNLPLTSLLGKLSLPATACRRIQATQQSRDMWPLGALLTDNQMLMGLKRPGDYFETNLQNHALLSERLGLPVYLAAVHTSGIFGASWNPVINSTNQQFISVLAEVENRKQSNWDRAANFVRGICGR